MGTYSGKYGIYYHMGSLELLTISMYSSILLHSTLVEITD